MKLTVNKTLALLASVGLLGFGSAVMAEDSGITGSPEVTVELGNLDAISMGTLTLGQAAQAEESLCVYSNSGSTGAYKVTFTATEGTFKLVNGSDEIHYTVTYNDADASGGSLVTYNTDLFGQDTVTIQPYPCVTSKSQRGNKPSNSGDFLAGLSRYFDNIPIQICII